MRHSFALTVLPAKLDAYKLVAVLANKERRV